jgi:multidrug efflux pump subunit AcrA (membrane-fusion protein)
MDVPRGPRRSRRAWIAAILVVLAAAFTLLLARLEPASPSVDRDLVVLAEVGRGPLPLEFRAWGKLASDQLQAIEATVGGRVLSVETAPGRTVRAGAVLAELASPEAELEAAKAEQEYAAAQAAVVALRRSLGTQRLEREARLADMRSAREASREVLADLERRADRGEAVELDQVAARDALRSLQERIAVEEKVLELLASTGREQIELETKRLEALGDVAARERARLEGLRVRAPVDAVVTEVRVAPGDWVVPGTELLRLLRPERMMAELSIPAPLAAKVRPGLEVLLADATGDTIPGTVEVVISVPGSASSGTTPERRIPPPPGAHVSVRLGKVPGADAAADAAVEGTIRLGELYDALSVKRPAWATEGGAGSVFRVSPDGTSAERVKVRFGLGSRDRIQVLSGLREGDVVIVSDMSRFDDISCVRLTP